MNKTKEEKVFLKIKSVGQDSTIVCILTGGTNLFIEENIMSQISSNNTAMWYISGISKTRINFTVTPKL
jgi:hypothetical protein